MLSKQDIKDVLLEVLTENGVLPVVENTNTWEYFQTMAKKNKYEHNISTFENKYQMKFEEFEQLVLNSKEDYEKWDDYMEWQAQIDLLADINSKQIPKGKMANTILEAGKSVYND